MWHWLPRSCKLLLRVGLLLIAVLGVWAFIIEPAQLSVSRHHILLSGQLQTSALNETFRIYKGKEHFWLLGLADLWTRTPNIPVPLTPIRDEQPVIILTYSPDIFPQIPPRVILTLAGHTHCGQVNLPVVGRPVVPSKFGQRYASGHIIEEARHFFVSSGMGTSILPVRFRVPSEVVMLTLEFSLGNARTMQKTNQ